MMQGLIPNANYEGKGVTVFHADKADTPLELVRTSLKMVFFKDEEGKVKRMTPAKLARVEGLEGVEPEDNSEPTPEQEDLGYGILSNTDYSDKEVKVKHEDKGWAPLVRTSSKVLYIDLGNENPNRMTLVKMVGSENADGEGTVLEAEEAPAEDGTDTADAASAYEADAEFDNDFNIGQTEEDSDGAVVYD